MNAGSSSSASESDFDPFSEVPDEAFLAGVALYEKHCANCHRELINSTKRNRTTDQIAEAILNVDEMRFLTLSDEEITLISLALNTEREVPLQPFSIARDIVKILPYRIRLQKLRHIFSSVQNADYSRLEDYRHNLGDYDYANGVAEELTWNQNKIELWTVAVEPLCQASSARFPYPDGLEDFVQLAYGRSLGSRDRLIIAELDKLSLSAASKFELFCATVLSSMEFISQ